MRTHLRIVLAAAATLALGFAAPSGAAAQRTITCTSTGYDRTHCNVDTRGGVSLARRLSDAPCDRNRTWGTTSRGVWVSRGCRAEFRVGAGSNDGYGNRGGWDDRSDRRDDRDDRRADRDDRRNDRGRAVLSADQAQNVCRRAVARELRRRDVDDIRVSRAGYDRSTGDYRLTWRDDRGVRGTCEVDARTRRVDVDIRGRGR
ncbi:MAG TPA: DUF3011 domain-containing protein [Longimicrobium sp.]|nr:DUF3011 domain-containing protein [Longimicrobium sp.]